MIKINSSKQLSEILGPFKKLKLDLTIIVDRCLSMVIWDEDISKLLSRFQNSKIKDKNNGIFRSIEIVQTGVDKDKNLIFNPSIDHHKRRLIIVISDCIGLTWRDGRMFSALNAMCNKHITAIANVLPERLWDTTALSMGSKVVFTCPRAKRPNYKLKVKEVITGSHHSLDQGIKLPVFSLNSIYDDGCPVYGWVEMVAKQDNFGSFGYFFPVGIKQTWVERDIMDRKREDYCRNKKGRVVTDAEINAHYFKMRARFSVRELAGYLAATPFITLSWLKNELCDNWPLETIVELLNILEIQRYHLESTDVVLSFRDENIRDFILKETPRGTVDYMLRRVQNEYAYKLDVTPRKFMKLLRKPSELEKIVVDKNIFNLDVNHLCNVFIKGMTRLGGPYAREAERIKEALAIARQ